MEARNNFSPKLFFKGIVIVYFGLLAGMVLFGTVMYVMKPTNNLTFDFKNQEQIVMILLMIICIFTSNMFYNRIKNRIGIKSPLSEKMQEMQKALILKLAPVEFPALLGIVLFILRENLIFIVLSAIMVLYFLTLKPSKDKILDDMNLTSEERRQFE